MLSKDIQGIYEAYSKMYQPINPPEEVIEEEVDGLVEVRLDQKRGGHRIDVSHRQRGQVPSRVSRVGGDRPRARQQFKKAGIVLVGEHEPGQVAVAHIGDGDQE